MSPAEGRDYDELDIGEVLASIRRLIKTTDSTSPSPLGSIGREPPLAEPAPLDLPALFRPSSQGEAEPRSDAMRGPPPPPFPPTLAARQAEPEQPRVMAPCKDTLIARMGQWSVPPPTAPVEPTASPTDEGAFCLMPMLPPRLSELATPKPAPPKGHEIPRATLGPENYLLGRSAADDQGGEAPASEERVAAPTAESLDVEQTAALLRPLLRQWVDDNMRQVFMKALRDEITAPPQDPKK
jgi:cell pole-organizing protein PopZ